MKNIPTTRVHTIQEAEPQQSGQYVLYWMSRSFRSHWNYALEYAVGWSEKLDRQLVVLVQLDKTQKQYTERHIQFLLQGLKVVKAALNERGIKFVLRVAGITDVLQELVADTCAIVTDYPYLLAHQERLDAATSVTNLPIVALEGNVVIPVSTAAEKQEYAARTIRKQLQEQYEDFLVKPTSSAIDQPSKNLRINSLDFTSSQEVIAQLRFSEHATLENPEFKGGERAAQHYLDTFLRKKMTNYDAKRQSPTQAAVSYLGPYLAWGMMAPAYVLSRLQRYDESDNTGSFLEEVLVRRELAHNFVHYASPYDSFHALPDWAKETLNQHKSDEREHVYTRTEFEQGNTHDEAWNACQQQLRERGYLHNHLRMYWGKQILAWSNTPQYALKTLLYLNNKYFLDGNNANSYANALWVFGLHDRAWQENEVFGKVRLMNRSGLDRKIDVEELLETTSQ
ncbi:MAG: deoxyribodipyrimidine photo-lyase [Bacteroidota bacterium]